VYDGGIMMETEKEPETDGFVSRNKRYFPREHNSSTNLKQIPKGNNIFADPKNVFCGPQKVASEIQYEEIQGCSC